MVEAPAFFILHPFPVGSLPHGPITAPGRVSTQINSGQPAPVLLAEDDENDMLLIRRAFAVAGVRNPLVVARDGEEALAMLKGQSPALFAAPCLLITDIKMPKVDGFELLIWLQNEPRLASLPKLVISSSILEHDLARSLMLGATAYFVKPNNHSALVDLVRTWKEKFLSDGGRDGSSPG